MGTRSLTVFEDSWKDDSGKEQSQEIVVMYRQMDGYPKGHGKDLAEFLYQGVITNGIRMNDPKKTFNGMGCLSAQVVAHFKDDVGGIYLHPAGTRDCWEDYIYFVRPGDDNLPIIKCISPAWKDYPEEVLFEGTAKEMCTWIFEKYENDV